MKNAGRFLAVALLALPACRSKDVYVERPVVDHVDNTEDVGALPAELRPSLNDARREAGDREGEVR